MKRLIIVLVAAIAVYLIGCSSGSKPENMSDHDYEIVKEVINITDDVLDGKTEAKDAEKTIKYYYDQIPQGDAEQALLRTQVLILKTDIYEYSIALISSDTLEDARNDLAKMANIKKR